jgi:hypothetical protein
VSATGSYPATVTLGCTEPIHNDDTSLTITVTDGAFSDGSETSSETTDQALSNSSTLDYPVATCHHMYHSGHPYAYHRKTGAFTLRAMAAAGYYPSLSDTGEYGIEAMEFTVSDGTNTETVTVTALS